MTFCKRAMALVLAVLCACPLCSCASELRARAPQRVEGFSVLAEPASADDALPAQIAEALEPSAGSGFTRADLMAARRVLPDSPVWLLPSAGGELCLAALDYPLVRQDGPNVLPPVPSSSCSTIPEALAGRLVVTRSLGTTVRTARGLAQVYGVVPDGVDRVQVFFRHGRTVSTEAIRNGYEFVVADPEGIEFRTRRAGRSLTETVHLTMPSLNNAVPAQGTFAP
jgi:hypothetical protein